jgi:hypothetical protein
MAESSTSDFKWKLTRDTAFDVWKIQFEAFLSTKGCLEWLSRNPDRNIPTEIGNDSACKCQIVLAMKDASLIRISIAAATSKAYWDALTNDFEGQLRIRKHEIVREERNFAQGRNESFVDYCDRSSELEAHMKTANIDTGCLAHNVILRLLEPFKRNNRDALTKLAHDSGADKAPQEVLLSIRQYSRLSPKPGDVTDGSAFAADSRSFKGQWPYSGREGHMQRHCHRKWRDEQNGNRSDEKGPAAALVWKSSNRSNVAVAASGSSTEDGVMLYNSCCTHHLVHDRSFLSEMRSFKVKYMRMGGDEAHRVEGQGTAALVGGPLSHVVLKNVLYVPTMIHSLFFRSQA